MKDTLQPGIRHQHRFVVTHDQPAPRLYPQAEEFVAMPGVLATGFLVGFLECGDRAHQRRLAGSVGSQQPEHPRRDVQGDAA